VQHARWKEWLRQIFGVLAWVIFEASEGVRYELGRRFSHVPDDRASKLHKALSQRQSDARRQDELEPSRSRPT
jgi:hypothetical protein